MSLLICTHKGKVWGNTLFKKNLNLIIFLVKMKSELDKLHGIFVKQFLGIKLAGLSKTNRSSLIPRIMTRMTLFRKHLQDSASTMI